eukprot:7843280-Alexandrium_andersonii.AAC.1
MNGPEISCETLRQAIHVVPRWRAQLRLGGAMCLERAVKDHFEVRAKALLQDGSIEPAPAEEA